MGLYRGVVSGLESERSDGRCDGEESGKRLECKGIYSISLWLETRLVRVTKGSYEQHEGFVLPNVAPNFRLNSASQGESADSDVSLRASEPRGKCPYVAGW